IHAIHENQVLSRWAALLPRPPAQVGAVHQTDAELVDLGDGRLLALTVDALIEEVAAGLFQDPFTAGRTAVIASVSDLSAVGADPIGLLLCVTLPGDDAAVQEAVARGVREACEAAGTFVLGGDTNDGPQLEISVTAAGMVPADGYHSRMGMAAGDRVYASGPLGAGAALAASALLHTPAELYSETDYRPMPRLAEGRALRGVASATMDTSDGLLATIDQLARLNGVAVDVEADPASLLEPGAARLAGALGLPPVAFLAAHHGEFELVFSIRPDRVEALEAAAAAIGWTPLFLGTAREGAGVRVGGRELDLVRIRNLLHDVGGDPQAYVAGLLGIVGG
ncbi:MAG: hypothetical protein KC621_06485, partial [Myxococcales bacterium]|nr:hypothetical protein [Myxococcales bacterium]